MILTATPTADIRQHNRAALRELPCSQDFPYTYRFEFQGADPEPMGDYWEVERPYLMAEKEIEGLWADIAEMNANYFVRGELEITYPQCFVTFEGDDFF